MDNFANNLNVSEVPEITTPLIDYIPPNITLQECERQIGRCINASIMLRWRVIILLVHVQDKGLYKTIVDDLGAPVYSSFKEYLEALGERIPNLSRRTYYERRQLLLRWLEMGGKIEDLVESSPTAVQAITSLGQWNRNGGLMSGDKEQMLTLASDTKGMPAGEIVAVVKTIQGEKKVLFFGSVLHHTPYGWAVELRLLGKEGDVYSLRGNLSSEVAEEVSRKLGFTWEDEQ